MAKKNPLLKGIFKNGNLYWLGIQRDKKRQFFPLHTDDLAQAIREAAKIRGGNNREHKVESGLLVEHAADRFVAHMVETGEWKRSTEISKGYVIKAFAKWCGKIQPSGVTPAKLLAYHSERKQEREKTTAHGNMMTIRSFFNWCRDVEKTVRENPCDKLKLKAPAVVARKNFCSKELVAELIRDCPREDLKFVLYCGFHAGLRFNEIVEARPFWFDLDAGILHLRKTDTIDFKDSEERSIPMTDEFRDFIKNDYGLREPFMLHPEKAHGKSIYRYDFQLPFETYMKDKKCEWVTPHIMRHTFASLNASSGAANIYEIAVWLGDDVRVVQRHYAKLVPKRGVIDQAFHSSKPFQASSAASTS